MESVVTQKYDQAQVETELVPARTTREWMLTFLQIATPDGESAVIRVGRTIIGAAGTRTLDLNPDHYIKDGPNMPITISSSGPVEVVLRYDENVVSEA
jgi:hypothetical protein